MILLGKGEPRKLKSLNLRSSKVVSFTSHFDLFRKLKQDLACGSNDTMSVISEHTGMNTMFGRATQAEKNISKLENNRAKDLEKALKELDETREELASLKTKYKAAVARRDTLENQMKDFKSEVSSKMKILIEKTGKFHDLC